MKRLNVHFTRGGLAEEPILADLFVGQLAQQGRSVYFEYSPDFLKTGLNLSPFRLPFQGGVYTHSDVQFGPLPGLFDDSLPDGWGRLLMDRHFAALGLNPESLSPLDRLSWLGTGTMGALTYHPPSEREDSMDAVFNLHDLARQAKLVLSGDAQDVLPPLLRAGGSPGGARPKVLVGVRRNQLISGEGDLPEGFEHWIVKFSGQLDHADAGMVEYAYMRMAAAAGLIVPPVRLFTTAGGKGKMEHFFGVQRFDRQGNRRFHAHTFGNLIQSNFRIPSCDYAQLLQTVRVLTRHHGDVLATFRQMVFNILAHNRDDHVKNFAFLFDDVNLQWHLSPAYDVSWSAGTGGEHTMTIAGEGKSPTKSHIQTLAQRADISHREVAEIIEQAQAAIRRWPQWADQAGVTRRRAKEIAATFPKLR
ncbi:MAG: type II toxin-antitoxin system HipA family toxin [Planctomycetia bacterium]|nr:type II toxin-antitoxin system HipA family toxin [Planctomycetia bacterium]